MLMLLTPPVAGTLVTFSWEGSYHNVVEVGSEDDLSSCTGATGRDLVGRAGPHVWKVRHGPSSSKKINKL